MKKLLVLMLFSLIFVLVFFNRLSYISALENDVLDTAKLNEVTSDSLTYQSSYQEETSYYGVYSNWMIIEPSIPFTEYVVTNYNLDGGLQVDEENSFEYGSDVVELHPLEEVTFKVYVSEEGLYEISFDYYLLPETILRPSLSLLINDEVQYNEMYNLELPIDYMIESEIVYDRFGDEITPNSTLDSKWSNTSLLDPNYFFTEPLKFYLEVGSNDITILINEGHMLLGDITIGNQDNTLKSYSEYLDEIPAYSLVSNNPIVLQAERYTYESKQNIRSKFIRDASLTPYSYKNRVQNVLAQSSYRKAGDSVTYTFDVAVTGFYNLTMKYLQSENPGLSSRRAIYIDGEIPFKEFENYSFEATNKYIVETLGKEEPYKVYLEAGTHTLTLSVYNTEVRDVYHELTEAISDLNILAREVSKLSGGIEDENRDYKFDIYMPTLVPELERIKGVIETSKDELIRIYGDDLAIVSDFNICIKYLENFIEDPNEIPVHKNQFNEGETSIYGRINTILPTLVDSPLQLDVIQFHGEHDELPIASKGFFVNLWEGIKSFFYSFFDPKYNEAEVVDENTVEVWVRASRLYIQVMQRMIDEQYYSENGDGTKILLSVMPDENKIVLANAAGTTPDAAMGLSVTRPFEFAIRGMVTDLSELDGFYDLASQFNQNSFIPYIYEDGIYSIPETMDVKLLFYRTDTLEYLGVEPPQTWEDVVSLIPVMQKYDYNFYTPLGGDNAFKTFGETLPFIFQHHGEVYGEDGDTIMFSDGGAYEAFEFMTDLFSIYNVPITTSNFYHKFRDGTVPIGIGDGNMYIQLKYAAPELAGQWAVLPIPGIEYEYENEEDCPGPLTDGVCIERWDPTYGMSSVIFNDSEKQDMAWDYFKWWFDSETQAEFTYQLQSLLGDEFLYMTANIEGFKNSAWPSDSKSQVLEQWQWIRTLGKIPGDYLTERELSNAWNAVVNDGDYPRVAIDDAVVIVERELERKLEEFGYYEDGQLVTPYIVPTHENVHLWFKEGEENE